MSNMELGRLKTTAAEAVLRRDCVEIKHVKDLLTGTSVTIPFAQLRGVELHEKNLFEGAYLLFCADGMQELTYSVISGHKMADKGRIDLTKKELERAEAFCALAQDALQQYLVPKKYVAVCGGVNIDICAKPFAPLIAKDSNPGRVELSLGGVGRNIAHNLGLLGGSVSLLTALGEDAYTEQIERSCEELDIDLSHALRVAGGRTSTYVFVNDERGDMALAVSDMSICEKLTPDYFEQQLEFLNGAALVILDTNLPQDSLLYIAENCTAPLFADPVSVAKAEKLRPILSHIHTLKPNRPEAELLSGVRIGNEADVEKAAEKLCALGVQRVFVSLSADGLFAAQSGESHRQRAFPANLRNATGAGDALMAALAWAQLEKKTLRESARLGAAAAAIATEGEKTINPALCTQAVLQRAAEENDTDQKEG